MDEVKLRILGGTVDEWKKMTKSNSPPILAVTIVHSDYVTKNPDAVAKFIAATRKAVEWGSKNKPQVAEILRKAANMNVVDALAYANQWDSAYFASFEAQDIATLKRMNQIFKAAGTAKKDVPDSAFLTDPYVKSKQIK
jgi:NitT/TauT family transport system substrate-binding protein